MKTKTPETDSRTQHVRDYLRDVNSSGNNQPCKTVVPSTWAQKLERQRDKALAEVEKLKTQIEIADLSINTEDI